MKCSMGTAPSALTVLPVRTIFLPGNPKANISDHQPMVNIAPFGLCRSLANPTVASATAAAMGALTPMPCVPNTPVPWIGGKMNVLEKGQPALLNTCKLQCMWAGTISIQNDGQNGVASEGAKNVDEGKQVATLYHYKKIHSELRQGYALLAEHVYCFDGSKKSFYIPGFDVLTGLQVAQLLGLKAPYLHSIYISEQEYAEQKNESKKLEKRRNQLVRDLRDDDKDNWKIFEVRALKKEIRKRKIKAAKAKNVRDALIQGGGDFEVVDLGEVSDGLVSNVNNKPIKIAKGELCIKIKKNGGIIDDDSGLKAAIYRRNTFSYEHDLYLKGDVQYILAFGGSDSLGDKEALKTDWINTNLAQGLGLSMTYPNQYKEAAILGMLLQKSSSSNAVVIGHSLGGGLASCACAASGLHGMTFNPAGLNITALTNYIDLITGGKTAIEEGVLDIVNTLKLFFEGKNFLLDSLFREIDLRLNINKEIYEKISKRSENVVAYCSRTDVLTNTQDNAQLMLKFFNVGRLLATVGVKKFFGSLFRKDKDPVAEKIKDIIPKTYGKKIPIATSSCTHYMASNLVNNEMLDLPKSWRKIILNTIKNCEDVVSVLVGKVAGLNPSETASAPYLNYLTAGNAIVGHSMNLLLDAFVLDTEMINNSKQMSYQNSIKKYINRMWAEEKESSDEITVTYKQLDKNKTEYGKISKIYVSRIDAKAFPVFNSGLCRNKEGAIPFNIQVEYKGHLSYMEEKIENVENEDEFEQ